MDKSSTAAAYLKELEAEYGSTRKCLERIPDSKFDFRPHPTSMPMNYLALLVAEIPRWIQLIIETGDIDFATFKHADIKTNQELVDHFEENMTGARKALKDSTPEQLERTFYLKADGKVLFSEKAATYIGPTLNHWVHHRGQLTVYMRICEIPVPSIYGPSADDKQY
ncbi:MAG: DinB family protein [Ferruginibacter sp.]